MKKYLCCCGSKKKPKQTFVEKMAEERMALPAEAIIALQNPAVDIKTTLPPEEMKKTHRERQMTRAMGRGELELEL